MRRGSNPLRHFFAERLKENSTYTNLGVIDTRGDIIRAGVPFTAPVNLSACPYFSRVLQQQVVFGESEIGVIAGTPTINIAFPIVDEAGQVLGAVFASLNLTWFRGFADAEKMPPGSTLVLAECTGTLAVRYPDMESPDARPAANNLAKWLDIQNTQHVTEFTDSDGVVRPYAFIPFDEGHYAGIGLPSVIAYSEVDQLARLDLGILLLVAGLALGGAWVFGDWSIARRIRALLRATQRPATGDLRAHGTIVRHQRTEPTGARLRSNGGAPPTTRRRTRTIGSGITAAS